MAQGDPAVTGRCGVKLSMFFPVAVNHKGQIDFHFVLSAPSFTDWGKIMDAYSEDSPRRCLKCALPSSVTKRSALCSSVSDSTDPQRLDASGSRETGAYSTQAA